MDGPWWHWIVMGFFFGVGFTLGAIVTNALVGLISGGRKAAP